MLHSCRVTAVQAGHRSSSSQSLEISGKNYHDDPESDTFADKPLTKPVVNRSPVARKGDSRPNVQATQQIEKLSSIIKQQQEVITRQAQAILQLQAVSYPLLYYIQLISASNSLTTLQIPPRSVDWVVRGVLSRWDHGFHEFSPEASFSYCHPSLRYTFKLLVNANNEVKDSLGVFFVPRRGQEPANKWPITNLIQLELLNLSGEGASGKNKVATLNSQGDKKFFASLAPPETNNIRARGHLKFLNKQELEAGPYLMNDSIVVRVTLLGKVFSA